MCFNISVSSCPCELRTDPIFSWVKVSSVIQTLLAAHIKGKMSNLLIKRSTEMKRKNITLSEPLFIDDLSIFLVDQSFES